MKYFLLLRKNLIHIIMILFLLTMAFLLARSAKKDFDEMKNPPALSEMKGVQNHLVWDVSGNCYFVRPHNEYTNYLVAVPDCNKIK